MALIRGIVLDPSRHPVAGAAVYIVTAPQRLPDVALLTDERGRFALTAPVSGTYVIGVRASTCGPKQVQVHVSDKSGVDLEIVLERLR